MGERGALTFPEIVMATASRKPNLRRAVTGAVFIAAGIGLGVSFFKGCGHFQALLDDEGTESFRAAYGIMGLLSCAAVLALVLFLAGGCLAYGAHLLNQSRRQFRHA